MTLPDGSRFNHLMKLRSFLSLLAKSVALLCLSVLSVFRAEVPRRVRFFWVDEDSEIYAAYSKADLFRSFNDQWRHADEYLTEANRGEFWAEVPEDGTVIDEETDREYTYELIVDEWKMRKWIDKHGFVQIATSYN